MGDATLRLERRMNILDRRKALVIGGNEPWATAIDGATSVRRCPEEVASFHCHGPTYGRSQLIAALVKGGLCVRRNACP